MKKQTMLISFMLIIFFAFINSGCSILFPPDSTLKIKVDEVDDPTMNVGGEVKIKWSYQAEGKLVLQKLVLVKHTILGAVRREFELDKETRFHSFIFQAPTTVFIMGYDSASAGVPITQVAIDILYSTDYYFEANIEVVPPQDDPTTTSVARGYPRLGYPDGALSRKIVFTNFVGIRDVNQDTMIQFFLENSDLDPGSPFRMISLSRNELEGFIPKHGGGFPGICLASLVDDPSIGSESGLCHTSVDLPSFFEVGNYQNANSLVFAGALALGGTVEEVKTEDGDDIIIRRDSSTLGEPIFMVIALHSGPSGPFIALSGNDVEIVDVYIGNVVQGLALSAYMGTSQVDAGLGSRSVNYSLVDPDNPVIAGELKGGYVEDRLNVAASEKFDLTLNFNDIRWRVPFLRDDDLLDIPTAIHPCELTNTCSDNP